MPYWQEEKKEAVQTKSNKERNLEVEKKFLQRELLDAKKALQEECKKSYTEGNACGFRRGVKCGRTLVP